MYLHPVKPNYLSHVYTKVDTWDLQGLSVNDPIQDFKLIHQVSSVADKVTIPKWQINYCILRYCSPEESQ